MARSNTNYYNLCPWPVGEDGYCWWHRPSDNHPNDLFFTEGDCVGQGWYYGRRGLVWRKRRFPEWSWKKWVKGPPRSIKRLWRRKVRGLYKAEIRRQIDDPVFGDHEKLLTGMYGWWA